MFEPESGFLKILFILVVPSKPIAAPLFMRCDLLIVRLPCAGHLGDGGIIMGIRTGRYSASYSMFENIFYD